MDISRKVIRSLHEQNPELEDRIDSFVIRLAERVDQLQDAERQGALAVLSEAAASIGEQAERLGYPDFARMAEKVCAACSEEHRPFVRDTLIQLTEITRRIRRGYRGAA